MELYELKILTVEDEPQVRKMICEILKEAGYQQVCTAGDCKEAREAFRTQAPDCVLLDVMLPNWCCGSAQCSNAPTLHRPPAHGNACAWGKPSSTGTAARPAAPAAHAA